MAPLHIVSSSMSSSCSAPSRSAIFSMIAARSVCGRRDQTPASKERRAASTAASRWSTDPFAIVATTSPVAGLRSS
nr:hypothetical protein [Sporichthya sp.]